VVRDEAIRIEAGALVTEPDHQQFITLSSASARDETERQEGEAALARDEARVSQIRAGRIARLQRITRWAFAAVGAAMLIAGLTVAYLQWDEARLLAAKEATLAAERAKNAAFAGSLNRRQVDLDHAQASILGELSESRLQRGELDSALRLAARGARIDLALPPDAIKASQAAAELAAAVPQANWRFGSPAMTTWSIRPLLARMGRVSSQRQMTGPRACGPPRPARRSRPCAAMTTA
jgi:hypothetical protein